MWHRDIKWTNAFVKIGTSRFVQVGLPQTFDMCVYTISVKHSKEKYNKMRYPFVLILVILLSLKLEASI